MHMMKPTPSSDATDAWLRLFAAQTLDRLLSVASNDDRRLVIYSAIRAATMVCMHSNADAAERLTRITTAIDIPMRSRRPSSRFNAGE